MEEAPSEVHHIHGPSDPRLHVLDANQAVDGDNVPVAVKAISSGLFFHPDSF